MACDPCGVGFFPDFDDAGSVLAEPCVCSCIVAWSWRVKVPLLNNKKKHTSSACPATGNTLAQPAARRLCSPAPSRSAPRRRGGKGPERGGKGEAHVHWHLSFNGKLLTTVLLQG
eukprot:gene18987-biopygen22004